MHVNLAHSRVYFKTTISVLSVITQGSLNATQRTAPHRQKVGNAYDTPEIGAKHRYQKTSTGF